MAILIKQLQNLFRPQRGLEKRSKYQISAENYFGSFLKQSDRDPLKAFLGNLGGLQERTLPVDLLAVGSSTFPPSYWKRISLFNARCEDVQIPILYQDIDIVVLPREPTPCTTLEDAIKESLQTMKVNYSVLQNSPMGFRYSLSPDRRQFISQFDVRPGIHSIRTRLPNQTQLDLFTGEESLTQLTPKERIAMLHEYNYPFSIVYSHDSVPKVA